MLHVVMHVLSCKNTKVNGNVTYYSDKLLIYSLQCIVGFLKNLLVN